jgi:anaerobic selenocysteine-containing dehydrogenase
MICVGIALRYVETVCPRDCYDTCFMKVSVDDEGKPTRTVGDEANPVTQGFLCPRGVADIKRTFSHQRILYPQMRVGGKESRTVRRIPWTNALDYLTRRLRDVLDRSGPESVLHVDYDGNMGLFTMHLSQRLFYASGFTKTDGAICSSAGHEALALHYGQSYGIDPEELPNMMLTVYWGFNAAVSAPHLHALSLKAKGNGGSIVAVDPRISETSTSANLHVQPKPGSDVALAYGVMKHLIEQDLVDDNFIQRYTRGYDELVKEVSTWNRSRVGQYTGLDWEIVAKLAESYAKIKPSVTMIGIGMQKSLNGAESVRAISLIPPLVGLHRAFFYTNGRAWSIDTSYLTGEALTEKKIKVVSQVALGNLLERGDFKFVYIYNMNPAVTLPNANAVAKGLKRDDVFVVVHDSHMTETAMLADLILPATTFLEKEDIMVPYSHRYVRRSTKVIEPLGDSKDELWVMAQLADRLNLKQSWLREDPWGAIEKATENAFDGGSPSALREGKTLKLKMRPSDEYQTPSGRLEFHATKAEDLNMTPLPKQHPLPEEGSFVFLNSAISKYTHTQFQDVYGPLPSTVFMNPVDAAEFNVRNNDAVELFNEFGSINLKVTISTSVQKHVLWSPRECRDANGKPQNSIVPDTTQNLGNGSIYNTTIVRVKAVSRK